MGGLFTFTVIEVLALGLWLALVLGEPLVVERLPATVPDLVVLAGAVLVVGLFLGKFVTDLTVNGLRLRIPVHRLALLSLTEALVWFGWLYTAQTLGGFRGIAAAGLVLGLVLVFQHTAESNVLRGEGVFSRLVAPGAVGVSLVLAVGATALLVLILEPGLVLAKIPVLVHAYLTVLVQAYLPQMVLDHLHLVGLAILAVFLLFANSLGLRFVLRGLHERKTVRQAVLEQLESA
ncbi:hypothetical protein [Haloarchaeobius sp. DT45]|uniref:hypothetical protein n=1 Tax=Haloarchaeobius sp. DT45 TaxID=3446116 RepID=UPI003F6AA171